MDEQEFWQFLRKKWEAGRVAQVSGVIDLADPEYKEAGRYIQSHAILPNGYDRIQETEVIMMGGLLLQGAASLRTKEAVMMILAHHPSEMALAILAKYNLRPDPELRFFAQMALEECAMWNE